MSLKSTIDAFSSTDASWHGEVPSDWTQGRTVYGGMTAALCLMAAEELSRERPLRSAFIGFVGPSTGALQVSAEEVRSGRNTSTVRARLSSELGPGVESLFTFAANRDSVLDTPGPHAPVAAPEAGAKGLEPREGAPAFTHNLEFIWADGSIPFSGNTDPILRSWVRHRDEESRNHPLSLLCLADALAPAAAASLESFAPMSSMTWMVDFFDDVTTTRDGWWLLESRADFAHGGHSSQDMTIWNADGACVAKGRQMITLFA